jgi:hypothetical protein
VLSNALQQISAKERGSRMKFTLIVIQYKDWEEVRNFETEEEAQAFVDSYPRFGGDLSRVIRNGNWQIISEAHA